MPLVVGVDSSTSACKVQVRDVDTGAVVAAGRAAHPPTSPPRSEQHPAAWEHAFHAACADAALPATETPSAISVAAQQHGLVVLGDDGDVLRPAKLWNDTESAPRHRHAPGRAAGRSGRLGCRVWKRPAPELHDRQAALAAPLRARDLPARRDRSVAARLAHLPAHGPADHRSGATPRERDTGRREKPATGTTSCVSSATTSTGRRRSPRCSHPDAIAGEWRGAGITVAAGTGDNMAAALGLGLRPGDLALSLGTSGTAFTVSTEAAADPTGTVAGFADANGRYLPLVCTMNATKVTDAVARLLGVDQAQFDALALEAPAGAGGLVLVPHLDGERTPNRPDATGSADGLAHRRDTGPTRPGRRRRCGLQSARRGRCARPRDGARNGVSRRRCRPQCRLQARRGGPHRTSRSWSRLEDELVAAGAAVQAAAVHHGRDVAQVAEAWGLGRGETVEPDGTVDRAAIRAATPTPWREPR